MLTITDLHWERANLHLVFSGDSVGAIFLTNGTLRLPLRMTGQEGILPVYNTPEGDMLPPGSWRLTAKEETVCLSERLFSRLDDLSRNFLYREGKYAYLVDFSTGSDGGLKIQTRFMRENRRPKRFFRLGDERRFTGKCKTVLTVAGLWGIGLYYRLLHGFHSRRSILFLTENSDVLRNNLKAFRDRLDSEKYRVRVFAKDTYRRHKTLPDWFREITALALSHVVAVDDYTPILTHLRLAKDVKLVQLWHAGLGFKSLGYARFGRNGSPHPYRSCHRRYTDVFVDAENLIDVYSEVFGCPRKVFHAFGMPRLEGYTDKTRILRAANRLYAENPCLQTQKTVLFAPTYRGKTHEDAYYDFSVFDFEKLYDFLSANGFVFLIKTHPFVKQTPVIPPACRDRIFDYSDRDLNELLYISDILATDYSSCAYEFSLFDRPLVFFRPDKAAYEYERQVYTLDIFCRQQAEAQTFEELLTVLGKWKDSLPADRLSRLPEQPRREICSKIEACLFEEPS